ncbi:flagellar biosynthesis protein FliQ [Desulfovirgula thermocuniculi]|uniref:flagellar biosynthesis protein FliQ n=1 Tax=Desulfovirgula thermocuniculi TaxID=348842 RepID=UPI0004216340|nr:flagellar biosynthesis protein FliQ [Desulfovirgula thermocuniculi]
MTDTAAIQVAREAIMMIVVLSLPVLAASLLVGLVISVLQATTQVQEQSLTFVPKILAVFLVLFIFAPWMVRLMVNYTTRLINRLPGLLG